MKKINDFIIDMNTPTTLLSDFDQFIDYIDKNKPELSKANAYIGRKHLYEMNKVIAEAAGDSSPKRDQPAYPVIHLFYHISISGGITAVKNLKKDKRILAVNQERMNMYNNLTNTEKYMFLLETLLRDVDWRKMLEKVFPGYEALRYIDNVFQFLMKQKSDNRIELTGEVKSLFFEINYFNIYLKYFGFFDVEVDKEDDIKRYAKFSYSPKAVTPKLLGIEMSRILYQKRKFTDWNIPKKMHDGEWSIPVEMVLPYDHEEVFNDDYEIPEAEVEDDNIVYIDKYRDEIFLHPFKQLFKRGELEKSLPPFVIPYERGDYKFTVYLYNDVWRRIAISSENTLYDLHNIIQKAFKFDDDHLYDFSIEREGFNDIKYYSPMGNIGPFVDDAYIGKLRLRVGNRMIYLFDYGDSWKFHIILDSIEKRDKLLKNPKVVESLGKAPKQYSSHW